MIYLDCATNMRGVLAVRVHSVIHQQYWACTCPVRQFTAIKVLLRASLERGRDRKPFLYAVNPMHWVACQHVPMQGRKQSKKFAVDLSQLDCCCADKLSVS